MHTLVIRITPSQVESSITSLEGRYSTEVGFDSKNIDDSIEVAPIDIWSALISSTKKLLIQTDLKPADVQIVRIESELEVSVFWDDETLGAVRAAIGDNNSHAQRVSAIIATDPQVAGTLAAGRLVSGTLSEYLISRMTRGLHSEVGTTEISTDATAFAGIAAVISA